MIQRSIKRMTLRALVVDDELTYTHRRGPGRAHPREGTRKTARSRWWRPRPRRTEPPCSSPTPPLHAILLDWTLGDDKGPRQGRALLQFIRSRNADIPIFLMAERARHRAFRIEVMEMVDEYVWTLEDTAAFVGGRVVAAIRRYLEVMLPPLAAALMKFGQEYEYSWHTPGHTGRHRVPEVARWGGSSSTTSARTCCGPTCRSAWALWDRCSTTPAPSASTSGTRPASSAPTAPTASPTAPRCRTG